MTSSYPPGKMIVLECRDTLWRYWKPLIGDLIRVGIISDWDEWYRKGNGDNYPPKILPASALGGPQQ